ncbi:MAG TPA: 30S ribosomal protein S14 [Gammaproteobacteria bacterium]|nr:30S ribosomal protein S14 [Gammaproteobacteria bacterium]
MARLCKIEKDKRQRKLVIKHKPTRDELRSRMRDKNLSLEEKFITSAQLQGLPRDSSPSRLRNRCLVTGRARGVYSKFGLGRNKLREYAMSGLIPGLYKASW